MGQMIHVFCWKRWLVMLKLRLGFVSNVDCTECLDNCRRLNDQYFRVENQSWFSLK